MKYRLALFDFDGTVIDSAEGITDSVLYALKKAGIEENDREKLRAFIGPPLFDSFKRFYGVSDADAQKLVDYYREFYGPEGHKRCSVYEGIPGLLSALRANGVITAVASAKPEEFVKRIIVEKDLTDGFDIVKGITFGYNGSDKTGVLLDAIALAGGPPADSVVMIGDRCYDVDAGKRLGVHTIGVLYGFGTREELENSGAEYIAETVADIAGLM